LRRAKLTALRLPTKQRWSTTTFDHAGLPDDCSARAPQDGSANAR
jgi:hypothetical protein